MTFHIWIRFKPFWTTSYSSTFSTTPRSLYIMKWVASIFSINFLINHMIIDWNKDFFFRHILNSLIITISNCLTKSTKFHLIRCFNAIQLSQTCFNILIILYIAEYSSKQYCPLRLFLFILINIINFTVVSLFILFKYSFTSGSL